MKLTNTVKKTLVSATVMVFISSTAFSAVVKTQATQRASWYEIVELHKAGAAARESEMANPNDPTKCKDRRDVYRKAADKLDAYMTTYLLDTGKLTYLRALFRLGIYFELADRRDLALPLYRSCLKHPLIDSDSARYDGRLISNFVRQRLDQPAAGDGCNSQKIPNFTVTGSKDNSSFPSDRDP